MRIHPDGSGLQQLTHLKGGACHPAYSPDGGKIAITAYGGKGPEIVVMDSDGGNHVEVGEGFGARWSPDGKQLVFFRGEETHPIHRSIWIAGFDGTGIRKVIDDSSAEGAEWLPDGRGGAFSSIRQLVRAIYRVDLDGTNIRKIGGDGTLDWYTPIFSPDGKLLIVNLSTSADSAVIGYVVAGGNVVFKGLGTSIVQVNSANHTVQKLGVGTHPSVFWIRK